MKKDLKPKQKYLFVMSVVNQDILSLKVGWDNKFKN